MILRLQTPPAPSDRRERRRLAAQDRQSARLAELHQIRGLLADAARLVESGWVQHGWFAYLDERGTQHVTTAYSLHLMRGRPVSGACLVGAIVHAGGGPAAVRTQLVQRSLDLTWHTLHEGRQRPVQWCPPPPVRAAHTRDLTRWNDQHGRAVGEVAGLLEDSSMAAVRLAGEWASRS